MWHNDYHIITEMMYTWTFSLSTRYHLKKTEGDERYSTINKKYTFTPFPQMYRVFRQWLELILIQSGQSIAQGLYYSNTYLVNR